MLGRVVGVLRAVECRVNPVEAVSSLAVAVAVGLVEHHLSCADALGVVDLPEHRHSVAGVSYVVGFQCFVEPSALNAVPMDAAKPLHEVVVLAVTLGVCDHLHRQQQGRQRWQLLAWH